MSTSKRAGSFPVLRIDDGVALIDTVKARGGWVAYALTKNGILATRFARRTKRDALLQLKEERRLERFAMESGPDSVVAPWRGVLKEAADQKDVDMSAVPLDETGLTDFTRRVYRRVRRIPRGRTMTYGDVAKQVGRPGAARAVGQVMARNSLAPFVPCHRVIGSDGRLCGFSSEGGLKLKAEMLEREGVTMRQGDRVTR